MSATRVLMKDIQTIYDAQEIERQTNWLKQKRSMNYRLLRKCLKTNIQQLDICRQTDRKLEEASEDS